MNEWSPETLEALDAYLEGSLSGSEREAFEARLREDQPLNDYVAFLKKVGTVSKTAPLAKAPSGLADRVMENVYAKHHAPLEVRWAPAVAFAAVTFVIGVLVGGYRTTARQAATTAEVPVTFSLDAPRAKTVSLAGDFTDWQPIALSRGTKGWELPVELPRGRVQYVFILNGKMLVPDPVRGEAIEDEDGTVVSEFEVGTEAF